MAIKKVRIDRAVRLYQMPPDLSESIPREKKRTLRKKTDILDLGLLNWPLPWTLERTRSDNSLLPASKEKLDNLREEIGAWFGKTHGKRLIPSNEIYIGGSLTTLVNQISYTFLDRGDVAFVPEPGIPLYRRAVLAFGGEPISYQIEERNNWKPSFERFQTELGRIARLLFLNSPHNPTGGLLTDRELDELVWAATRANILIVNDAAYQSLSDGRSASLIGVDRGKRAAVEIYSFSYAFGMPTFPFGFAVGNKDVIRALTEANNLFDPWIPDSVVDSAIEAIRAFPSQRLKDTRKSITRSSLEADKLCEELQIESCGHDSVPFKWCRLERRKGSVAATRLLYRRYGIRAVPGTSFGNSGQGFLRLSLTADSSIIKKACQRVSRTASNKNDPDGDE